MRPSTVDDAPPASNKTLARRCEVGTSVATGTGIAPRERKARNALLVGAHTVQVVNKDRLPTEVNGHPVDVEQVGTFRRFMPPAPAPAPMPDPRTTIKPARPGCSIGYSDANNQIIMAGTFGALVSRGTKRFVLSNSHVLAYEHNLPLGSSIFQPGFLDAGNPPHNRVIARLSKFVPLVIGGSNSVDCAIARWRSRPATHRQEARADRYDRAQVRPHDRLYGRARDQH